MAYLLDIAIANLLVAALLALLAALVGLWGRRPAVTHALWLLVLLKLITPPLFDCPVPWLTVPVEPQRVAQARPMPEPQAPPFEVEEFDMQPLPAPDEVPLPPVVAPEAGGNVEVVVDGPPVVPNADPVEAPRPALPPPIAAPAPLNAAPTSMNRADIVVLLWLAGSCVWLAVAVGRLWRFHRLLRFAEPAPAYVQHLAREMADRLSVRCPDVGVIPGNVSPMLWALGRSPRLLLPKGLLERLSADQLRTLLAHELAHWRRRDDRVRWIEVIVLALYWWCPLVWWARRELHQAEEECCDAWVVSILPDSAKEYALALVETVDFLSGAPAMPVLASGLGRVRLLKRRLKMILQGRTPRALTFTGLLAVAGVGLLLLPMVFSRSRDAQVAAQPEPKGFEPRKKGQPEAREEIQRIQQAIQQRQQELQKGMEELQQMIQRLQQIEAAMKAGQGGPPPMGPGPGGANKKAAPPGIPVGPGGFPPGGPGGFPPPGGGFQGGPPPGGFPGANPPGGFVPGGPGMPAPGQGGGAGPNLEKRLNQVEQKLDVLLQELRGLRQEMNRGPKGPPNPGAGGGRPPMGPMGPMDPNNPMLPRFVPNVPPVPPAPPRPPVAPLQQDDPQS